VSQQVKLTQTEHDLWDQRVDELELRFEGSPLEPLIARLYQELAQAGIDLRPPCYVANEWGCPDGLPLIGVPFYLVDPRLHAYEDEYADDLEDAERIMMGLRHEAGHAINYAYKLYTHPSFEGVFGRYDQRYHDDYVPEPFSRRCVRHLPGWYAQKHPDEDFAETFALWLTPGSGWREKYAAWPALAKLELIDQMMKEVGHSVPLVDPASVRPDPNELAFTVAEFYRMRGAADAPPAAEIGGALDDDLREVFTADGPGTDAGSLLWDRRRVIMRSVSACTGSRLYVAKVLIEYLANRLRALGLRAAPGKEVEAVIGATALVSTLVHNFLRFGHFLPRAPTALSA
jgi:hypothetical protein